MNVGVTATAAAAIGSVLLSPCAVTTSPTDKPQVDRPDPPVAFIISGNTGTVDLLKKSLFTRLEVLHGNVRSV